jgi:Haemolysin secretion/activation protein ShlB/FhaC/HecB
MGRQRAMAGTWAVLLGLSSAGWAGENPPDAVPGAGPQAQRVIAGQPVYDRSGYFKWHFGEGYRKIWTSEFDAPILDLGTFAGGLTPVRQVGSMQSIGLALKGADGRSYTFRTLDKDPKRILPEQWRDSFPATLFQDQTTASHPGSPCIVPALAEAAGVPHTWPLIVFMPDEPALGSFREAFGGKPGTIDVYPTPAADGQAAFQGAVEIINTGELWQRWKKGEARVDANAMLRARLFDLFLGDWDRHNGQWRWMKLPGQDALVPLPEDRDQAFANFSGALMTIARSAQPKLVAWHDDYENLRGLLVQGREIDDWLLSGVSRTAFEEAGRDLQARLTDSVIESAVHRLPPEWFALGGAELIRDLRKRRDLLPQVATAFYESLARWVDVQGTDRDEVVTLTREADGSAVLELATAGEGGVPAAPYFSRRFLRGETKEVRVYLYGGNDRFTATGPRGGVPVRVSGGAGTERFDDSRSGGTRFYDVDAGEVQEGPGTSVTTREWKRVPYKKETPWMDKQDFGSLTLLQPLLWWEPDPGIVLSMGATRYTYGFRKQPYSSMQHVAVEYKTKRTAFGASYEADFRWARPGFATFIEAWVDGADNYNFYGAGNESPKISDEFNEADQRTFYLFPSLFAYENQRRTFWLALGPEAKFAKNRAADDTLVATEQPYGFGDFGQVGGRFRFELDTRGRTLAGMGSAGFAPGSKRSDTGLEGELDARLYPKAWDVEETFGVFTGWLTGYWQPASQLTLAARVGGQKNWGRYPWHESAFIGGSDSVRGYDRNRFAGDSSAYGNVQAMVGLFNLNLVLPLRVGVLGLVDTGRVWVEGESSDKWHSSAGGGIYVRLITTDLVAHALLAHGDEGTRVYANIGFGI